MLVKQVRQFGAIRLLFASAACAALAGCQAAAPPPPAPQAEYQPRPITLPSKLVQAAGVYEAYVDSAAGITAEFADGESVGKKMRQAAAYEAVQFQRGEGAYAAIVALQDPTFVASVRAYGADPSQRTQVVSEIVKDPAYVLGIKGSDSAAGLVVSTLSAQGQKVLSAGEKVKQAAYDIQKSSWSMGAVPDRDGRLATVKSLSITPGSASMEQTARLQLASSGQGAMSVTPQSVAPPYSPLIVRSLAVAALAVLGEGGEANTDLLWSVLNEPNQGMCFNMAKLNLYQCLAVAKPYYEDVFCLGQHVLMDTGQCINKASGVFKPPPAAAIYANATPYGKTPVKKSAGKKSSPTAKKAEASPPPKTPAKPKT